MVGLFDGRMRAPEVDKSAGGGYIRGSGVINYQLLLRPPTVSELHPKAEEEHEETLDPHIP